MAIPWLIGGAVVAAVTAIIASDSDSSSSSSSSSREREIERKAEEKIQAERERERKRRAREKNSNAKKWICSLFDEFEISSTAEERTQLAKVACAEDDDSWLFAGVFQSEKSIGRYSSFFPEQNVTSQTDRRELFIIMLGRSAVRKERCAIVEKQAAELKQLKKLCTELEGYLRDEFL